MLVRALKSNRKISVHVSNGAVDTLVDFLSDVALYKQQPHTKNVTFLPQKEKKNLISILTTTMQCQVLHIEC
jgi:hypothetical protein